MSAPSSRSSATSFSASSRVRRIHLVTAAVAKLRRRLRRLAKRSVKSRTIFRGVRNDRDVLEFVFVQFLPDRPHTPVHHVRGRHQVRPRPRMRQCLLAQNLQRRVVQHFSVLDHPAMPVIRVLAQAHIRNHQQVQFRFLESPQWPAAPHRLSPVNSPPADPSSPAIQTESLPEIPSDSTSRHSSTIWSADCWYTPGIEPIFIPHFRARANKHRINKSRRAQPVFPHQPAQFLRAPQTPRPVQWKAHSSSLPPAISSRSP